MVSSLGTELVVAAIAGRADRQLTSPFLLVDGMNSMERATVPLALASGVFVDPTHESVASIAAEPDATGNPLGAARLWIAPMSGDADVDTTNIRASADVLPSGPSYVGAQMVAVDLDPAGAGGLAEVVAVAPPTSGMGSGALLIGKVTGGVFAVTSTPFGGGAFTDWRLVAADVDADGAVDVVVFYGDSSAPRKVAVLWNTQSGTLDPTTASEVTLPQDPVTGFACANFDADPALEIALLTGKGAFVSKLGAHRSFGEATALAGVTGGVAIASGDVDGDGVNDLAISSQTMRIFLGVGR